MVSVHVVEPLVVLGVLALDDLVELGVDLGGDLSGGSVADNASVDGSDRCNLCGGSLYVDGGIAAFALGERLDRDSVGVHFEKGLASIRGIYQVINQIFVQRECADVRWVNRAQDLNEEGLRHAKESYRPAGFLQKSRVAIA